MISNLKSDIEFRREKALELSVRSVGTWPPAASSQSARARRSIQPRRSVRNSSTRQPSSSAESRPSPGPSVKRCANSRRLYEQAQTA